MFIHLNNFQNKREKYEEREPNTNAMQSNKPETVEWILLGNQTIQLRFFFILRTQPAKFVSLLRFFSADSLSFHFFRFAAFASVVLNNILKIVKVRANDVHCVSFVEWHHYTVAAPLCSHYFRRMLKSYSSRTRLHSMNPHKFATIMLIDFRIYVENISVTMQWYFYSSESLILLKFIYMMKMMKSERIWIAEGKSFEHN